MTVTTSLRRITFIDKNTSLSNLVTSATSAAITEDPKHIDIIRDEVVTPRIRRPCSDSKCIHTSPMMAVTDRVTSEGPSSHVQGTHTAPFHYTSHRHTYGCNSSKHVTSRESLSCPFVLSDCKAKKKSISLLRRCVVIYDNNRHSVKASLPENSSSSTKLTQQSDTMKKDTEQLRRSKTKIMRNNCKCCRTITPSLPSEQRDSIHRRFGILSNIPCKTTLYNGREKEDPKDFNSYTNPAADEGAPDPCAPDCVHIDNPCHNSIEVSCASSSKGIPQDTNVDPPFCKTIPPQPVRAVQVAGEVHRCGSEGNPWNASYDECVETEVIVGSDDNGQKGDSSRLEVAEGVNSININNGRYVPVSPSFLFGRGNDKNEYEINDISIKVKKCSKLSPLHLYNPRAPARNTSPRGDDKSPLQPLNIHQLSSSIVNGYTKTSSSLLSATNPIRSPSPDEKLDFSSGTGRKTVSKLTSPQIFESSSSKPTAHDIHIRTLCPRCSSHWPYAVISHNTCLAEGIQSDTHVSNMSKVALSLRPVGRSFPSLSNIILSHDLPANRDNSGSYRPSKDLVALKLYMTDRKHLKKCRKVLSESSNSIPVHNTSPSRGINQTKSPGRAIPLAVFTADPNLVNSILRANSKNVKKGSNITRSPYFRTHLPSPTSCDGQQSSGMTICGYSRTDRVVYDPIWCGQCYTSLVNNAGKDQIPSSVDVLQEGSDEYIRHATLWPLPCIGFQLSQVGVSDVKKQQEHHMGKDVKGQMGGVDGCVHDKEMINDVLLFGSMAQATLATEFVWEQLCGEYQYIHGYYSNRRDVEDNIPTISIPTKHKATTLARAPFTPSKSTISQLSHSFIVSPSTNSQNTGNRQSILLSSLPVTGKQLNSLREVSTRGANKQKTSVTNVMLHPTNTHSLAKRHAEIIKDHVQSSESVHLRHIKGDHRSPMGHEQTLGTSRCLTFAEEDDDEKKMVSFPLQPTLQASKTGTVVVSQEQRVSPSPNSTDNLPVNIGSCNTDELMPVKGKRCADRSLSRGIITKRNSKAQPINTLTFDTNENLIPTLSSPCAVSICSRSSNGLPIRDYSISEARGQNLFISSHQYIGRPNNYPLPISSHHCNSPLSLNSHSTHSAQSHQHSPSFQQSASSPSFVSRSHNFLTPARSAATPSCQVIATDTGVDDHQHQLKRGRSFNSQGVINEKEQQKAQQFYLHHQTPLQPGHSHEYTSGVSPVVPSRAASSLGSFFSPSYRCSQVPSQIPSATNVMSRSPMPSPLCGAGAVITPRTVASFQLSPTVSPSHFSAASNIINTNEKGPMSPNGPLYSVASQQQSSSGLTFLRRPKPTLLASTANTNPTTADHEIKTHFSPAIGLSQNRKIPIQNSASHKNDIKEITSNNHASVYALAECSPTGESCTSPHTISLGVPCRGARSSMAEAAAQYCEIDVWGRSVTPIAQSKAKMNSPNRQASNTSCFNHLLYY